MKQIFGTDCFRPTDPPKDLTQAKEELPSGYISSSTPAFPAQRGIIIRHQFRRRRRRSWSPSCVLSVRADLSLHSIGGKYHTGCARDFLFYLPSCLTLTLWGSRPSRLNRLSVRSSYRPLRVTTLLGLPTLVNDRPVRLSSWPSAPSGSRPHSRLCSTVSSPAYPDTLSGEIKEDTVVLFWF